MSDVPPLHAMNPLCRFTDRATDYRRYRPGYPAAAIDAIVEGLGEASTLIAADVGAGTGISSRLLAERGVHVHAIEPNAAMRDAAEPHQLVTFHDGTGEATGLADESLDLVVSAQAFHWFQQPEAIAEFHRVLRPGRRLALMWNNRDRTDALTRGFVEAIHAVNGEDPIEKRPFDPAVIHAAGRFTPAEVMKFPHVQPLDRDGLIGRATSASYVPREGPAFEELRGLLEALHAKHQGGDGRVAFRYVTTLYRAERR
jgi:SAM-dependent methyltransferase